MYYFDTKINVSALMVVAGRSGGEDNAPPGRFCAANSLPVTSVRIATITRKKVTPNSPTVKRS